MSTEAQNTDVNAEVAGTEADKINTGALGTLVAVGLFAMISITAAVTALVRHDLEVEEAEKDSNANQVVMDLKAAQRGTLEGPAGYVDRGKGTISLPIDLAKGLVLNELAKDPSSATPPAPAKAEGNVDGAGGAATLGSGGASAEAAGNAKAGSPGKSEKTEQKTASASAPETGRKVLESGGSTKAIVPTPTPTAATPGAENPGPTNK